LVVVVGAAGAWLWCWYGLSQARTLATYDLWPEVYRAVARYLVLHPNDSAANLLCAEALIKDERLGLDQRIDESLARLGRIADTSSDGARARIAEARVQLFLQCRPFQAEQTLRRAMELAPDSFETNYLMWKLLDLTGRSSYAEPYFWKTYESGPVEFRALWLREWFMTQFYPTTASSALDGLMGFARGPRDNPSWVESHRFIEFRDAEPESPLAYAALARWFQAEGDLATALELLDRGAAKLSKERQEHPFYLAALIDVLIDLGEFERADECFERWSAASKVGEYWLVRSRVMQEIRGESAEAVKGYDQALREWPGPVDWRTMNRRANCLARLGDEEGAARERERAKAMEALMDGKALGRVRFVLGFLRDADRVKEVEDFYRRIGRSREAACWSEYIGRLNARPSGSDAAAGGGESR